MRSASPIRIGIIGLGKMGVYHLKKLLSFSEAEVVGVYDVNYEVAHFVATELQVRHYSKLEDLFFDTEAVVIASPTSTHFEIARAAIVAGNHVFVEKPLTPSTADSEVLAELSLRHQVVLQVGFVERYRLGVLYPALGVSTPKVLRAERKTDGFPRDLSVDVVLDLMIHDLHLAVCAFKNPPRAVHAHGVISRTNKLEMAEARLDFGRGRIANLFASWESCESGRKLFLVEQHKQVLIDLSDNSVRERKLAEGEVTTIKSFPPIDALALELKDFISSVRAGSPPLSSLAEALAAQTLAGQVRESALRDLQGPDDFHHDRLSAGWETHA